MNRKSCGRETVDIVERGWYEFPPGERVDIQSAVANCRTQTSLHTPEELETLRIATSAVATGPSIDTVYEVTNETTLSAAYRLVVERGLENTLCLNFASAKNPGGGFLGGAQAQEESLARSSALYASLLTQPQYYEANRRCGTALYTHHMILSPSVPVFRRDDGQLLPRPYLVGILTAPAVNAGAVRANQPDLEARIRPTMALRIPKALTIAATRGYGHLVLGAWGCGVFRNDPQEIAALFGEALLSDDRFRGRFRTVTFAVLDGSSDRRVIAPFERTFAHGAKASHG
jgi:uncharacterized protein (TIGR02452 family)